MSGMESFIEKQTKLLEMQPADVPDKDPQQVPKECEDNCLRDTAVVAQELTISYPGERQDLCFLKEGPGRSALGLREGGLCSSHFSCARPKDPCFELLQN